MTESFDRVRTLLERLENPRTKRGFRLVMLRKAIRLLQDEYDRELSEWESLNSVKADPSLTVEVPI